MCFATDWVDGDRLIGCIGEDEEKSSARIRSYLDNVMSRGAMAWCGISIDGLWTLCTFRCM